MSAFKFILKRLLLYYLPMILTILIARPSVVNGQNFIQQGLPYTIKIDTITKIDTTYIIDTIISRYTYIVTDTIYPESKKETFHHKLEGNIGLTLNQLAITHWAAGGESSGSGKLTSHVTYSYKRKLFSYVVDGIFAYGLANYAKDKRTEKSEDRCELSMTASHNNNSNLTFTSIASLKTQFSKGYAYPNDSVAISGFFAPAYLTLSAGYNYNFNNIVSVYVSPIAGRMTFVMNQELADAGSYGVEAGYWNIINGDSTWVKGKNILSELGVNVLIKYKHTINEDLSIFSTLNLYNNYMDPNKSNRWNIDVDWETGIKFTINKRISTILNIHLIYDDNIKFNIPEIVNGVEIIKQKPILQFKESLGITFLYKFATK